MDQVHRETLMNAKTAARDGQPTKVTEERQVKPPLRGGTIEDIGESRLELEVNEKTW